MQRFAKSMPESEILDRVLQRTRGLVAENLRSTSLVISRMRELIVEAHRLGHSHKDIHACMEAGGLQTSWNNYKSCLMRMKKGSDAPGVRTRPPSTFSAPSPNAFPTAESAGVGVASRDLRSATHVLDALSEAKQLASRDYAQIARDLHRKTRK
jgi:hypothetical protein